MTDRDDITGDRMANSKGDPSKYANGWELAFGKKSKVCYNQPNPVEPEADGVSTIGTETNRTPDSL